MVRQSTKASWAKGLCIAATDGSPFSGCQDHPEGKLKSTDIEKVPIIGLGHVHVLGRVVGRFMRYL